MRQSNTSHNQHCKPGRPLQASVQRFLMASTSKRAIQRMCVLTCKHAQTFKKFIVILGIFDFFFLMHPKKNVIDTEKQDNTAKVEQILRVVTKKDKIF